jgi:hypothetical protein
METYHILEERLEICEKHIEENEFKLALLDVLVALKLIRDIIEMERVPDAR